MWRVMLKVSKPPSEKTLRQVNIGSEQVSARLWNEAIKWTGIKNVVSVYGITETANWIGGVSAQERSPQDGLVGRVWDGHAAVRSESGTISASGEGEILVKTPSLMSGYLNRPEETSSVMVNGFFATGDIGLVDPTGVITVTGRKKLEINRGGIKVSPEEIEALIERHDTVAEVCVFGMPHEVSGETVAAAVVLCGQLSGDNHADSNKDIDELKISLRQTVIPEKIPEKWYILEAIPKTERGKIDRARIILDCL
jgi:acyl-CoA synthetase (AMP-forming)/AMP-acid ligase II